MAYDRGGGVVVRRAAFALVFLALSLLNDSRTGRAWRALREDPLAAEQMSMPVNRLKLLAFAFGAGIGWLTGALLRGRAPENRRVFAPMTVLENLQMGAHLRPKADLKEEFERVWGGR